MMTGKHGQAAMEYLMTYGWALLVIVIVIAILLLINPFAAPQGCRFDQIGFTCNNPVVDTNGTLFVSITNGNNNMVKVYAINCTTEKTSTSPKAPAADALVMKRSDGTSLTLERQANYDEPITCYKPDGTKFTSTAGADFNGRLWLFYKNDEDGPKYPYRTASANVVAKVVQAQESEPGPG